MSAVRILLYLIILTLDKSPGAAREFASIEGRWRIVRAENHGKTAAPHKFGDYVEFVSSARAQKQPLNAVAFRGELKPGHSPERFDISTITVMLHPRPRVSNLRDMAGQAKAPPLAAEPSTHPHPAIAIYQISGDRMKLLVAPMSNPEALPPRQFITSAQGNEFLLEMRRDSKPTGAAKQK
jgi:hypothetical protein